MRTKKYKVNEIFYSLQGEGYHTGCAAIFVRFSGCNLKCPFCDTSFSKYKEMSEYEIVDAVTNLSKECKLVVFTGGEPTLQLTPYLVQLMHNEGYQVAVETNGTRPAPYNVDWVTVSPKSAYVGEQGRVGVLWANELKVVFDNEHPVDDYGITADYYYLQPCDTANKEKNEEIVRKCLEYIGKHPKWRLSLQTQKIVNIR